MEIKIDYNGEYPVLCMGHLKVTIDGTEYEFPEYCLTSGGAAYFDEKWDEHLEQGEWSVSRWPEDFPEEFKQQVEDKINDVVSHGCCGGCF
jgi:hypothetical protein